MNPEENQEREATKARHLPLTQLKVLLETHLDALSAKAKPSTVNAARAQVLQHCRQRSSDDRGIFELTVPTGGGKTLAAMAFALRHACQHGLERVIVVLPFTAIIEQNANVYRQIFGEDQVLEHHHATDLERTDLKKWCEEQGINPQTAGRRSRLLAENWDAPIIVTTSVQFFESLHSATPSRCRKLHRLAKAVVILDEVQCLPPNLVTTTLATLKALHQVAGTSLVLCTATQPAFGERTDGQGFLRPGLGTPSPIIPIVEQTRLFHDLQRVDVQWPKDLTTPLPWTALAERIQTHPQVLTIVPTRKAAADLTRLLGTDCIHLSTRMIPTHRRRVLADIRQRLQDKRPCQVVSTSLIEAGVDVDFPVVFRAIAGMDSLAQAAGRCNREGGLGFKGGQFIVYVPEDAPSIGFMRQATGKTMVLHGEGNTDLSDPDLYRRYFARLYDDVDSDAAGVVQARVDRDFPELARRYRLIDDTQIPVAIRWSKLDEASKRSFDRLVAGFATSEDLRKIRQSSVPVPRQLIAKIRTFLTIPEQYPIPIFDPEFWQRGYDEHLGFQPEDLTQEPSPDSLVC
jgi:CRISPR-associated endonuclease/helicase Cas3